VGFLKSLKANSKEVQMKGKLLILVLFVALFSFGAVDNHCKIFRELKAQEVKI